jgi:MFS transporter, DHA2 family, methylenomycin A resistance protein
MAVGAALLTVVGGDVPAGIVAGVVLVGTGLGLAGASLQAAALEAVPPEMAGSAAGLFSTTRYFGSITGSLAIAVLVTDGTGVRPVLGLATAAAVVALAAATRLAPSREVSGADHPGW